MSRSRVGACAAVLVAVILAGLLLVPGAGASRTAGPLVGAWSGEITGAAGKVTPRHIHITINPGERSGTWRISASCQGRLTLQSISSGYHHYLRHLARGATCAGGDVDCLKRAGAGMYDAVTSHLGGTYDASGTLRRVRG